MSGDAKNSEINSVAIYSRLTKNMSQIDWTIMANCVLSNPIMANCVPFSG